jgi:pilus assembly protein CpaE
LESNEFALQAAGGGSTVARVRAPGAETEMTIKGTLRSDQQVDVLLLTQDAELKDRLSATFREKNHFALRALKGRAAEVEDELAQVKLPEILIVDLNTANIIDIDALERIKRSRFAKVPIIALSSYLDQDVVRSLVQIKIDDWLPKDTSAYEVYKSCEKALRAPPPGLREERDAVCYSFFPVSGGCGNTTLAIESAFILGRRKKQMELTCLVDLNFQDGAIVDYLDVLPSFKIEELSNAPGRLDRQLLDVMLTRHSSGLAVLASPRVPAKHIEVSEGLIASVLGLLSKSFDNIVIDLPKNWYPWTDNIIWGSNKVFVVTPFTVPGLRHARFVSDAVAAKAPIDTSVQVIVNRFHEPLFGSGLMRKDAERLLSVRLGGFVPDAGSVVQEAINRGLPLSEVSPSSKLEKKLTEILVPEKV